MVAYSRVRGGAKRKYLPAYYTKRPLEEREDSLGMRLEELKRSSIDGHFGLLLNPLGLPIYDIYCWYYAYSFSTSV